MGCEGRRGGRPLKQNVDPHFPFSNLSTHQAPAATTAPTRSPATGAPTNPTLRTMCSTWPPAASPSAASTPTAAAWRRPWGSCRPSTGLRWRMGVGRRARDQVSEAGKLVKAHSKKTLPRKTFFLSVSPAHGAMGGTHDALPLASAWQVRSVCFFEGTHAGRRPHAAA